MFYYLNVDTKKVKDLQKKLSLKKDNKGRVVYILNHKDYIYTSNAYSREVQGFSKDGTLFFKKVFPHQMKESLDFLITLSKVI